MKIPETTANVGAYYGNEENGQWQPNGVIIDSGVGGGVVGSGDAGIHRPPVYPVHIPRGHMPGYVMAGAYFPAAYPPVAAPAPDDFADYMWMENEEEFDKQVMQQLEEEALMEQCIEAMLEDEQRERNNSRTQHQPTTSNGAPSLSLEEAVSRSTLNPLAAEFVPTGVSLPPTTDSSEESHPETTPLQSQSQETNSTDGQTESLQDRPSIETTEDLQPPKEPPEVSAADVQPIDNKRPKEQRDSKVKDLKKDTKRPAKVEVRKTKPVVVKSETKVQPKKKDVKTVKSDVKLDEEDVSKPQATPTEETPGPTAGFKPVNYAAAARANKPRKAVTAAPSERTTPPVANKTDKKPTPTAPKVDKPSVQRKNSAKPEPGAHER